MNCTLFFNVLLWCNLLQLCMAEISEGPSSVPSQDPSASPSLSPSEKPSSLPSSSKDNTFIPEVMDTKFNRRVMGSVMMPEGSPWCGGKPSLWFTGHFAPNESGEYMFCENSPGLFNATFAALPSIDRHGCTSFDVNKDGIMDLICTRGAMKGTGTESNNEVFLTQPNGNLEQICNHGLESPTRRSEDFIAFKSGTGDDLVFEQVRSNARVDGLPNNNQLYKWVPKRLSGKYFVPIRGPWDEEEFKPLEVQIFDFDGDGKLDIFIHAMKLSRPQKYKNVIRIYLQRKNNRFFRVGADSNLNLKHLQIAKAADLNNDGLPDIIGYHDETKQFLVLWNDSKTSDKAVHFTWSDQDLKGYNQTQGTDSYVGGIAILDVNGDGQMDIFATQSRNEVDEYCYKRMKGGYPAVSRKFGFNRFNWQEVANYEPPSDPIADILFIGESTGDTYPSFMAHTLNLDLHGCAGKHMFPFGEKRLAISHSLIEYPGRIYVLDWS